MAFTLGFRVVLVPFGVASRGSGAMVTRRCGWPGAGPRWPPFSAVLCLPSLALLYFLQQRRELEGA